MSDDIKRKISALLGMTKSRGCSEAEAMAAAEKAAQLMQEHGLTEADVLFGKASAKSKTNGNGARDPLWGTLARNTNTALIYEFGRATFVGTGPGPEIAAYLFVVLGRAIDGAIAEYKGSTNYRRRRSIDSKRRAVQDFTHAMVRRLQMKLEALFEGVRSSEARALAMSARDQMFTGGTPVRGPAPAKLRNGKALLAGLVAGEKVELSHGVSGAKNCLSLSVREPD